MTLLRLTASSGRIHAIAEERADIEVERGARHGTDDAVEVRGGSHGVVVRVPRGTELVIGSASGAVELEGPCGPVRVTTRSGRVSIESCTSLDVRTVSGRVEVAHAAGDARVKTGNGRVHLAEVGGEAHVATVSGRVEIERVGGPVRVSSVSGRIDVALDGAADARADSVSGRVSIALPEGVHPEASLHSISGRCTCEPEQGSDCSITARSVSGALEVVQRS